MLGQIQQAATIHSFLVVLAHNAHRFIDRRHGFSGWVFRHHVREHCRLTALGKDWKTADLEGDLDTALASGRKFAQGKEVFESAQCMACHKFGNEGGALGPDLTAVASRFKHKDILESITEPSKVVSDQFKNTQLRMTDGDVQEGKIMEENDSTLVLQTNPLDPKTKKTVKKSEIKSRALSTISPMPEGLMNNFTKEEFLDLIAYMESAGKKDYPAFKK